MDNDADTRERRSARLTRDSWRIVTVENDKVGLAAIASEQLCLILLDLMRPEMNGFALLNVLRATPE